MDLDFIYRAMLLQGLQVHGQSPFRGPAAEPPILVPLWKPDSLQVPYFGRAEPIVRSRHIVDRLFEPINVHVTSMPPEDVLAGMHPEVF